MRLATRSTWALLWSFMAVAGGAAALRAQAPVVYRVSVTGVIENGLAPYIERSIREADAAGAAAIYLDINTPGGRVDAAERIADAIRQSRVPVHAFVNPRAYSAGALIALATDDIYMRPGAVIGAATPVDGQGEKASPKIVSAMRGQFRALAEERGLDPRIAEAMVDEDIEIPGVTRKGELLTLSTGEAIDLGVAEASVENEAAFLAAIGVPDARVVATEINWAEQIVRFVTHPIVAPLLLSLGMLGLVFEIKTGGFGLAGLVGLLALGLFFGSNYLIGLAGLEEFLLLGLGMLAILIEIFIIPGFGVAGILGAAAIGSAVVLAMLSGSPTGTDILRSITALGVSLLICTVVGYLWLRHLPTSNRFAGLVLRNNMPQAEGYISADLRHDLIGQGGVALTDLRPAGVAQFGTERVDVVTEGEYLSYGTPIEVIRAEGYRQVVRAQVNGMSSSKGSDRG